MRESNGRGTGQAGSAPDAYSASKPPSPAGPAEPPTPPEAATVVFGDRLAEAHGFAALLADTGVSHGLIGPREVPILWERHVLNCAVVHPAFPEGAELVDVGSGAGLPGIALAIVRPDLQVHLVEPMLRRTEWLSAAVQDLGLPNCPVHRPRAEEVHGRLQVAFATARAVARVDKLARWTFPLLADGGTLVALKGDRAQAELDAEEAALRRLGMTSARVRSYGEGLLETPTVTLELTASAVRRGPGAARRAKSPRSRANRGANRR